VDADLDLPRSRLRLGHLGRAQRASGRVEQDRPHHRTSTVTILPWTERYDDLTAAKLQRLALVLEQVRARGGGDRRGQPHARLAAAAMRLVQAQHDRVRVLGALDRVEHEAARGGRPRRGVAGGWWDPHRTGELNAAASATTPPSCQEPAWGRSA